MDTLKITTETTETETNGHLYFLYKRLYINEIQHLESFCTRDNCLEKGTKCVIFLPLEGLKRHV